MKKTTLVFPVLALMLALLISLYVRADTARDHIANSLVRFHVIANSELAWDQELKHEVRNAVVQKAEAITRTAADSFEAKALLSAHLPELEQTANAVLLKAGAPYSARAALQHRYFPTKSYAGFRLPAGDYDALSITLGAGAGRNFWCVLFPPICISPVSITEADTNLTEEELSLLTEDGTTTRYRFFLLELLGKIEHSLQKTN